MTTLSRDNSTVALTAAYPATPLIVQVREGSAITLSAQYTAHASAVGNGQGQFYIELIQRASGGTARSLGQECIRGENPAASGHMQVIRDLDHQTRVAAAGVTAASEQIWAPGAVACDELHIYAKEIGDAAHCGSIAFTWMIQ